MTGETMIAVRMAVPTSGGQSSRMRVLVVDDSERVRKTLATGLHGRGFVAETAEDGVAALALLNGLAYDVVVLDLMMPRMDGAEVCRRLRRRCNAPAGGRQ